MPGKDRGQQWVRVDALEQRVQRRPFALQVRTGAGPARDDRGVDVERTRCDAAEERGRRAKGVGEHVPAVVQPRPRATAQVLRHGVVRLGALIATFN